ncbi:amidohydrolase family protein, partial [Bacteroidota bacterium]
VPSPASKQDKAIAIIGATAHLGNGKVINNALLAFNNGKITQIKSAQDHGLNLSDYKIINAEGKHLYPGLILANVSLGLVEVGSVRATVDAAEIGVFNPNIRSIVAYNTDSEVIPTLRSNGILLAQITPGGGLISGSSSIVQLDAWNWSDAAFSTDEGIYMSWPARTTRANFFNPEASASQNKIYDKTVATIDKFFNDANAYKNLTDSDVKNLKLESMRGLFDGTKTLYIRSGGIKENIESITLAKKHNVKKIVLVGVDEDILKMTDFLKDNNIPVIVAGLMRTPKRTDGDVKIQYKIPYLLNKEGILIGLDLPNPTGAFNLPFYAGAAAAYGMDKEEALKTITSNMAKILGIDNRVGTIETGKDATLILSTGDLLDIRTSNVEFAFIEGRRINLDNKHKRLYRKYKNKYEKQGY